MPQHATTIGPYAVVRPLGRGGMATVYLCEHVHLERRAAVKIPLDEVRDDERALERFRREARTAAGLNHESIIRIYDVGLTDDPPWIAMQYIEGTTLADELAGHVPLSLARTVELLGPVASALDAVHAQGLTHRDVKPSNILLGTRHGREWPVLTDFGIVRALGDTSLTHSGQLIGSPGYLAPEQVKGATAGPPSDLYTLACVAYQCLTGLPPFRAGDRHALALAHANDRASAPSAINPRLEPWVDPVLAAALVKDPGERAGAFPTATAFVAALSAGAGGRTDKTEVLPREVPQVIDLTRTEPLVGAAPAVQQAPVAPAPVVGPRSRRGAFVAAAVVVAVGAPAAYVAADSLVQRVPAAAAVAVEDVLKPGVTVTAAQRALLEQGPLERLSDCEPQPEKEIGTTTAALGCTSSFPGVDSLLLRQSAPGAALTELMDTPNRPAGTCATQVGVDGTWARGPLSCYDNSAQIAALWFGFADSGVNMVAIRNDSENDALYRWFTEQEWTSPAGPG